MPTLAPIYLKNLPNKDIVLRNPFKNKILRSQYDAIIKAFNIRHKDLIRKDREGNFFQSTGNSWAQDFWTGYNGMRTRESFKGSYDTSAYACWRAGNDIRKFLK